MKKISGDSHDRMAQEICNTLKQNGPLWSLKEEWCGQAFQQAHAVRGMLAAHRIKPRRVYLDQARIWADFTLHMQGTEGHPDRLNMGYFFKNLDNFGVRNGIPNHWYVADCGTIAATLLDVASLLKNNDELRKRIINSVCRFADYIMANWDRPDGAFNDGYAEFKPLTSESAVAVATAESILFLWPLAEITRLEKYRRRALRATQWMAKWRRVPSVAAHGYNGESLMTSLFYLRENEKKIRDEVVKNLENHVVEFALRNFGNNGAWFKNNAISNAKDPLLLLVVELFQRHCKKNRKLQEIIKKAHAILEAKIRDSFKGVQQHGLSGMAIAIYTQPKEIKEKVFWPKYYMTDGLVAMALAVHRSDQSLFPLFNLTYS